MKVFKENIQLFFLKKRKIQLLISCWNLEITHFWLFTRTIVILVNSQKGVQDKWIKAGPKDQGGGLIQECNLLKGKREYKWGEDLEPFPMESLKEECKRTSLLLS